MGKKHGFSFSWKRASGLSAAKGKLSRQIGIPLTRAGRQRKIGKMAGCCFPFFLAISALFGVTTALLAGCQQETFVPSAPQKTSRDSKPEPTPEVEPVITEEHKTAIGEAIRGAGFNLPSEVGLNEHGYVFAVVDLPTLPSERVGEHAMKAVLAMRNAVYVLPGANKNWPYKLRLMGPSPGPDLVSLIGTARFTTYEGASWKLHGF